MLINELPAEILFQILSKVSQKDDIRECMNVCKVWRKKLAPVCYENISVHRNHECFLQHVQTKIFNTDDRVGVFVKTLTFGEETENPGPILSRKNFKLLIDSLPSLQAIRFDRSNIDKTVKYLEFLERIAKRTKLQEVSITGCLPANADFVRTCHPYYSINSQIKHQITTLALVDTSVKFQDSQKIFEYIKGFVNLQHLTLYNLESQPGFREDIDVTSVLDSCNDNLQSLTLESSSLNYITGDHRYHYNLISLTMELPGLLADHLIYLVEYVPNLKELDLVLGGDGQMIETIYDSLDPDMAYRFTRYIKKLQIFRFYSGVVGVSPNMDVFWKTIEGVYNGQALSNLVMTFGEVLHQYETIYFDNKIFNVDCDFQIDDFNGIARGFQFLHLNSVAVHFSVRWIRQLEGTPNTPTMSDLLDFAVSQQHVQANLVMDEQQIILCKKPVVPPVYKVGLDFPEDWSPVQYVYLAEVYLHHDLLDKLHCYYPAIKDLKLINCKIQKQSEETNHYVIDLKKFRNLQDVLFEFESIQKQNNPILFQWTNGGQNRCYIYDRSISETAMYTTILDKNAAEDIHIIKMVTFKVQRLVFQLCNKELEIFDQESLYPLRR